MDCCISGIWKRKITGDITQLNKNGRVKKYRLFLYQNEKEDGVMNMYLFDEPPILANKTLAREIGLN